MNEKVIRDIARDEAQKLLLANDKASQYSVPQTSFHTHNGIDSSKINFLNLSDVPISYYENEGKTLLVNSTESGLSFHTPFYCVATNTSTTTNVDVFGSNGAPYPLRITGVFLISLDTDAGNITVLQGANTVCTIAKGTVAGAMVGAVSLSNTTYDTGDICQIDSSSTGDATVFITFVPI